jgi:hypothetical protein
MLQGAAEATAGYRITVFTGDRHRATRFLPSPLTSRRVSAHHRQLAQNTPGVTPVLVPHLHAISLASSPPRLPGVRCLAALWSTHAMP